MLRKPADPAAPGRVWKVGELAERTGEFEGFGHGYDQPVGGGFRPRSSRQKQIHGNFLVRLAI